MKKSINKIEDEFYWLNRKDDDERKDWRNNGGSWIEEYVKSAEHPHRDLIIDALKGLAPFAGIMEAGCNAGPNLLRLSEEFPETQLAGFDINQHAVEKATEVLPRALIRWGELNHIPFDDQSFDVVICDAVLMYADPTSVREAMSEFKRVARKAVIIVDWYDESIEGVVKDNLHWARDYAALLAEYGFESKDVIQLTEESWPNARWAQHGKVFVSVQA